MSKTKWSSVIQERSEFILPFASKLTGLFNTAFPDETYANKEYAQKTLRILGYVPFARAVLDDPDILSSAPEEVQTERGKMLALRRDRQGLPKSATSLNRVAPNRIDLTAVGSGRLGGGAGVAKTASELNTTQGTAGNLLSLLTKNQELRKARQLANIGQEFSREAMTNFLIL